MRNWAICEEISVPYCGWHIWYAIPATVFETPSSKPNVIKPLHSRNFQEITSALVFLVYELR